MIAESFKVRFIRYGDALLNLCYGKVTAHFMEGLFVNNYNRLNLCHDRIQTPDETGDVDHSEVANKRTYVVLALHRLILAENLKIYVI